MIINNVVHCSKSRVEGFQKVETSTISDVLDTMGIQGVASGIRPVANQAKIVGPAVTARQLACTVNTYAIADFSMADVLDFEQQGTFSFSISPGGRFPPGAGRLRRQPG